VLQLGHCPLKTPELRRHDKGANRSQGLPAFPRADLSRLGFLLASMARQAHVTGALGLLTSLSGTTFSAIGQL
jgi:hypothetical protein